MAQFDECKKCGAVLKAAPVNGKVECAYCGSVYTTGNFTQAPEKQQKPVNVNFSVSYNKQSTQSEKSGCAKPGCLKGGCGKSAIVGFVILIVLAIFGTILNNIERAATVNDVDLFKQGTDYETVKGLSKGDKKDGIWYWENSDEVVVAKGEYNKGREQGVWSYYYDNGILKKTVAFDDGIFDGPTRLFYESGAPLELVNYYNGDKKGAYESWYENGNKKLFGSYQFDKKEGVWTEWNENGTLKSKTTYDYDRVKDQELFPVAPVREQSR